MSLTGSPGLSDPCEKEPTDATRCLTNQQKEEVTASAQVYFIMHTYTCHLIAIFRWFFTITVTCVSRPFSSPTLLRIGGFCVSKVLLTAFYCWRQLAHSNQGEDVKDIPSGVTYIISIHCVTPNISRNTPYCSNLRTPRMCFKEATNRFFLQMYMTESCSCPPLPKENQAIIVIGFLQVGCPFHCLLPNLQSHWKIL